MGTFVTSGTGVGVAVKVGKYTELGNILKLRRINNGEHPLRKKVNNVLIYAGVGVTIILLMSIIYKTYLMTNLGLDIDNFKKAMVDSIDLGRNNAINLPL